MSRSGYSDDLDDYWPWICWRGAVKSAIRGKRGQSFLQEMLAAMDALPERKLIAGEIEKDGDVCAIGSVARARAIDTANLDPDDSAIVARTFGISDALAREIAWLNDEAGAPNETPEQRFERIRKWIDANLKAEASP